MSEDKIREWIINYNAQTKDPVMITAGIEKAFKIFALAENQQLETEVERLKGIENVNRALQKQITEATKAGTPYSAERDGINALILINNELKAENAKLKSLFGEILRVITEHEIKLNNINCQVIGISAVKEIFETKLKESGITFEG